MVDLNQYDAETIDKAFWLQQKIKRDGLKAVRFMATAEAAVRDVGPDIVSAHISKKLKRL